LASLISFLTSSRSARRFVCRCWKKSLLAVGVQSVQELTALLRAAGHFHIQRRPVLLSIVLDILVASPSPAALEIAEEAVIPVQAVLELHTNHQRDGAGPGRQRRPFHIERSG
jgi:hypothetical protein